VAFPERVHPNRQGRDPSPFPFRIQPGSISL
jgi:hypothetical protein